MAAVVVLGDHMGQTLTFRKARVGRIQYDTDGYFFLTITAPLTKSLLTLMGADYIRSDGREKSIDFDYGLEQIRFELVPAEGMEDRKLAIECRAADRFKAIRKKDKIKGRTSMVKFRLTASGDPLMVMTYILKIGGAAGTATLAPIQGDLFSILPETIPAPRKGNKDTNGSVPDKIAAIDGKAKAAGDDDGDDVPAWVTPGGKVQ
jgi:hypothetical protein